MKKDSYDQFVPSEPAFNDGSSNLSDFLWQANQSKGEGTERAQTQAKATKNVAQNAISSAQRHAAAIKAGSLKGEEYYTQSQPMMGCDNLCQSDIAVESRQISKEEFPQG